MPGPFVDAAASLLLGAACPGCRTPCAGLCARCAALLHGAEPFELPPVHGEAPVVAAAAYADVWQQCLVSYKERNGWWLGRALGEALALAVATAARRTGVPAGGVALVPMPSQPRSVRERGLDTTLTLARVAGRALVRAGIRCRVEPRLRHRRAVADQSELSEAERRTNLAGALEARPLPPPPATDPMPVLRLVVDDLTTTGSSLREACRALAGAGTPASACAVVAATPLWRGVPTASGRRRPGEPAGNR